MWFHGMQLAVVEVSNIWIVEVRHPGPGVAASRHFHTFISELYSIVN
jgi:hypothetical protein